MGGLWEYGTQRTELGAIGGGNAQAMAFDQGHAIGIDTGTAISAANGTGMAAGAGSGQSLTAAIAGNAYALHQRVDTIAVALGVAAALENHDASSFAGEHAVGGGAIGPCRSGASEGAQLAEDEREVNVGLEVDAAHNGQIGATRGERLDCEVEGDQGRGARGVDHVGRAGKIEAMCEPAGSCVRELARDGCRFERREA